MQKYGKTLNSGRIFPIFYNFAMKRQYKMKYFEVDFIICNAPEELLQDARDILSALAGEAGFETFEDTENGIRGYVQQSLFDEEMLNAIINPFPMEGTKISYNVNEADDKDWNEQWEQEGFEPIVVKGNCKGYEKMVIIHDGRHLPEEVLNNKKNLCNTLSVEIDAHLAFGTGNHETTRMMVASIIEQECEGSVLDCGCGTGILGIIALKNGAKKCVAYDIDEWSSDNARHNAVINGVSDNFTSLLGDVSVLNTINEKFSLVMANINRNILLNDMGDFRSKMAEGGKLLLSGFYKDDIQILSKRANELGLSVVDEKEDGEWACLILE